MAAPSIELSSTRRSALPMVVPNPRSNGCARKFRTYRLRSKYRPPGVLVSENLSKALCILLFGHGAQLRHPGAGPIPVKRLVKADLARNIGPLKCVVGLWSLVLSLSRFTFYLDQQPTAID